MNYVLSDPETWLKLQKMCCKLSKCHKLILTLYLCSLLFGGAIFTLGMCIGHTRTWQLGIAVGACCLLCTACWKCADTVNSEQTDEDSPSRDPPTTKHRNSIRLHSNKNFSTENNGEVILRCTDWETFDHYPKAIGAKEDCVICFEPLISRGRLVPCGHATFCFKCSIKLTQQDKSKCPLCRTEIRHVNYEDVISMV